MKWCVCILLFVSVLSCEERTSQSGDIRILSHKGKETEILFHNRNTTELHDIGFFLSIDELFDINPVKVEFKVTAPNNEYWIDTLYFDSKERGNTISFSGRKELYSKAYRNVCFMQGGDYKFTTRIIDINSDLIYMAGVIIEKKERGKR